MDYNRFHISRRADSLLSRCMVFTSTKIRNHHHGSAYSRANERRRFLRLFLLQNSMISLILQQDIKSSLPIAVLSSNQLDLLDCCLEQFLKRVRAIPRHCRSDRCYGDIRAGRPLYSFLTLLLHHGVAGSLTRTKVEQCLKSTP
jgi:hypothetical protein